MSRTLDNTIIWNEASKTGLFLGLVSIGCLGGKELAALSGKNFLITAAAVILWVVEFFGCIQIMKNSMLSLRERYEGVKIQDTLKLGRRAALLSGLLLASAQTFIIIKAPEAMAEFVEALSSTSQLGASGQEAMEGMLDKLPLITFISQWLYCFLYGTVLASIVSRYIFLQKLFNDGNPPSSPDGNGETPDEQ